MRVAILVFPGSNCDRDMMVAVEKITGRRPALVWHKDSQTNEKLDKDRFRRDLGSITEGYKEIARRLGLLIPSFHETKTQS